MPLHTVVCVWVIIWAMDQGLRPATLGSPSLCSTLFRTRCAIPKWFQSWYHLISPASMKKKIGGCLCCLPSFRWFKPHVLFKCSRLKASNLIDQVRAKNPNYGPSTRLSNKIIKIMRLVCFASMSIWLRIRNHRIIVLWNIYITTYH